MVSTKVEEIVNPRRILAVALTDSSDHLGAVIRDLTGTAPIPQEQQPPPSQEEEDEENSSEHPAPEPSLAGITHHLPLSTLYYTASIPIWLDLISSPADWSATFLSEEAKEVLGVLGGVVCVFEIPFSSTSGSSSCNNDDDAKVKAAQKEKTKELINGVGKVVREGLGGWEWEGVGLAVGVTTTTTTKAAASDVVGGSETTTMEMDADMEDEINEWDDLCAEWGLEFVHHRVVVVGSSSNNKKGEEKRNEYGEKMGIARVLEALQSNDWSGGDGDEGDNNNNNNNNRGLFDESEDEEDYNDENDGDTEDEFDLGFGYTKKQKMEMRNAFLKGTKESNRTAEEELEASKSVTETIEGQEKTKKGEEKAESASVDTDAAKAGPSAESGSGADKVKEEEEDIGEEDVEKIAKMMLKLQAVRDMSGTVPDEQRRKLALKAVEEVMREL